MGARPASVLFVFRRQRTERLELYRAGTGPVDMFYGLTELDPRRFVADFVEGDDRKWSRSRCLCFPIEVLIARQVRIGFALHMALDNLNTLRAADVIVSTVDACGLPIAMLKHLGLLNTPTVYVSQGLAHSIARLPVGSLRRRGLNWAYGRFLRSIERVLVLGEGAVKPLVDAFGLTPERAFCLPFGIDERFWTPTGTPGAGDFILSVGSDPARDYGTLLRAVGDEPLKIVTRLPIRRASLPPNVTIESEFTDVELRELYRGARFVVIPLQDVDQPSGQSATLQAMACGKAVILTRTRGLWEPSRMIHLENCYLVAPASVDDLRRGIRFLAGRPDEAARLGRNARRTVEERYTSRHFAAQLERHIAEVLAFYPRSHAE